MTSDNTSSTVEDHPESTSDNTKPVLGPPRRGRAPVPLPVHLEAVHAAYVTQLGTAPLDNNSRRAYASRIRQYLAWLEQENGMDDAQIHETIEELVAEEHELWRREAVREPDAAGVRPSEVVGRYEQ